MKEKAHRGSYSRNTLPDGGVNFQGAIVFVSAIYRLYALVQIDGSMYRVKLTVKDLTAPDNPAKLLHALEAVEIENAPLGTFPASSATNASVQQGQPTTGRGAVDAQTLNGLLG